MEVQSTLPCWTGNWIYITINRRHSCPNRAQFSEEMDKLTRFEKRIEKGSWLQWEAYRRDFKYTLGVESKSSSVDVRFSFGSPYSFSKTPRPAVGRYPWVSHTLLFALSPLHLVQISVHVTHHIVKWLVFVYISFSLTVISLHDESVLIINPQTVHKKMFLEWTFTLESAQLWAAFLFWPEFFGRRNSISS